uniref:Geranylgeranyl transferase type-2 subunit alpha n=2 Tax=Salix viminalis TaxID=40686 RepID=A0A6N2LGW2_SALVM
MVGPAISSQLRWRTSPLSIRNLAHLLFPPEFVSGVLDTTARTTTSKILFALTCSATFFTIVVLPTPVIPYTPTSLVIFDRSVPYTTSSRKVGHPIKFSSKTDLNSFLKKSQPGMRGPTLFLILCPAFDYCAVKVFHQSIAIVPYELNHTQDLIDKNISNYSAWHNRSVLVSNLMKKKVQAFSQKDEVLIREYELVRDAVFTDEDDQSGWFYHLWLLDQTVKAESPLLTSSWPAHGSDITLSGDRYLDLV